MIAAVFMNQEKDTKAIMEMRKIAVAAECTLLVSIPRGAIAADMYRMRDRAFAAGTPLAISMSETRPPAIPPIAPPTNGIHAYVPISARLNPRSLFRYSGIQKR